MLKTIPVWILLGALLGFVIGKKFAKRQVTLEV